MEETKMQSGEDAAEAAAASSSGAGAANDGGYDCNICLELAQDPVVTMCGHLFCWPCLYRWLSSKGSLGSCKECPVCKSAVEEASVVPIYGRGKGTTDPRTKVVDDIPNRPAGRRTEVPQQVPNVHNPFHSAFGVFPSATAQFGSVTFSAGFGLFPSLFGISLLSSAAAAAASASTSSSASPQVPAAGSSAASGQQGEFQEALLHRLLIFLGVFVVICLCLF